jgi:hypothetical protein
MRCTLRDLTEGLVPLAPLFPPPPGAAGNFTLGGFNLCEPCPPRNPQTTPPCPDLITVGINTMALDYDNACKTVPTEDRYPTDGCDPTNGAFTCLYDCGAAGG